MVTNYEWARVIKEFHSTDLPPTFEREINIPVDIKINRAITIIGPRRSGKTYEMFNLIKKITKKYNKTQVVYLNLENPVLKGANYMDLLNMLRTYYELYPENLNKKLFLFLDEVQNIDKWEIFARYALDKGIKLFLSGSSSKLLTKEIATSMRGRTIDYIILPFSFREFILSKGMRVERYLSEKEEARVKHLFKEYLKTGGYPEVILYKKEWRRIMQNIVDTTIYKDVIERIKVKNSKIMDILINYLINSKQFSSHKFYNFLKSSGFKISKNTIYRYIEGLKDVFFVFFVHKFDTSYKKRERTIPKVYLVDNAILSLHNIDDKGRLLENLVFMDLIRRGKEISYYKDTSGKEVDFVIHQGKKVKNLIQVCYELKSPETLERESSALLKASKELKCKKATILTLNTKSLIKKDGITIKIIPTWRFILNIEKIL